MARRWPPAASPTIPRRVAARSAPSDSSLDHDNPLEEVFEDQLALRRPGDPEQDGPDVGAEQRRSVTTEIGKTLPRAVKVVRDRRTARSIADVLLGLGAEAEADLASRPSHHELEGEHDHDDFDTFIVELPVFDSPQRLIDRLAKAAEAHDILRMKGFVDIAGKPMRLLRAGRRRALPASVRSPLGGRRGAPRPAGRDRREGPRQGGASRR